MSSAEQYPEVFDIVVGADDSGTIDAAQLAHLGVKPGTHLSVAPVKASRRPPQQRRSLRGALTHLGPAPSWEDFEAASETVTKDLLPVPPWTKQPRKHLPSLWSTAVELSSRGTARLPSQPAQFCPPREVVDAAAKVTFGCRRPYVTELRAVERLMNKVARREELDTASGKLLSRMRTLGLISDERPTEKQSSNPPRLSDDVRYSLLLDELPPQGAEPAVTPSSDGAAAEAPSE